MRTSDPAVSWEEDVNPDSQNGWKSSLVGRTFHVKMFPDSEKGESLVG